MENFRRFPEFFRNFLQFFRNFLQFFWKIFPKFFAIFFDFCDFPTIFPENFSENSRSQSVTVRPGSTGVQPGSRHYCKLTIKFTPKFTPILIKILQSTKFEGSHFFNSLAIFSTPYPLLQILTEFLNPLTCFRLFALLSLRRRVFPTIAPPCQRYQRPSLPSRWRRYVGNTRDYK